VITPTSGDTRHALHSRARIWPESNCYIDSWIGLLHTLDLDPVPMLLCALDSRFELDQWTFCKPSASELATLYGIRVEELNLWRSPREHVQRQVSAGRVVLLETDSFYLPDTDATNYQREHSKTTIAVRRMNSERREVHYLHNTGSYVLRDDDFDGVFSTGVTAAVLPPFAEFVDVSGAAILDFSTLRERAVMLAQRRLSPNPAFEASRNPFLVWMEYAERQLDELAERELEHFHAWAFATVRQAGAMSELLSRWCRWMSPVESWLRAATLLEEVARAMAAQQFRLARVPGGGRRPDLVATLERCAPLWGEAHTLIRAGIEASLNAPRTANWRSTSRAAAF
jgi:hypothetical protein